MKNPLDRSPLYEATSRWKIVKDELGDAMIKAKHGTIRLASKDTLAVVMQKRAPRILARLLNAGGRQLVYDTDSRAILFPLRRIDEVAEIVMARKRRQASPVVKSHLLRISRERAEKAKAQKAQ